MVEVNVTGREDVVGLDSCVILAREVWEASGHVETFSDPLTECTECNKRYRADHLEEAYEAKHGKKAASLSEIIVLIVAIRESSQPLSNSQGY